MTFRNSAEEEFWKTVFVAAVRLGACRPMNIADQAVEELRKRTTNGH